MIRARYEVEAYDANADDVRVLVSVDSVLDPAVVTLAAAGAVDAALRAVGAITEPGHLIDLDRPGDEP